MKKFLLLSGALLPAFGAFAEGGTSSNPLTDSSTGLFSSLSTTISDTMDAVWPIIGTVVGIGALIWLGFTLYGVITKFFGKAKGRS